MKLEKETWDMNTKGRERELRKTREQRIKEGNNKRIKSDKGEEERDGGRSKIKCVLILC